MEDIVNIVFSYEIWLNDEASGKVRECGNIEKIPIDFGGTAYG